MAVLYIVLLIGILVFVHEFGHLIVAKAFKVKVLSFSIGMGPRMFGVKRGDTDWVVRWLPLGGYVQMLGADPGEDIPDEDRARAFSNKPLWVRSLVILAGPLANLILPIPILFGVLFATYSADLPPVVGTVQEDTPADGLLLQGDEIIAIEGEEVHYWLQLVDKVRDRAGEPLRMTVLRGGEELDVTITPSEVALRDELDLFEKRVGRIGITPDQHAPVIGITDPNGAAAKAGLQSFDELTSVNGTPVHTIVELETAFATQKPPFELLVLREHDLGVPYGRLALLQPLAITLDSAEPALAGQSAPISAWGFDSAAMFVSQVDPDSPAAAAGLQRGDRLVSLNGRRFNLFYSLVEELARHWEDEHALEILRNGQPLKLSIQLEKVTVLGEYQEERPVIRSGFYNSVRRVQPERREVAFGDRLAYASFTSVDMTAQASSMLVMYLVRMAQGEVSTKSLGGPIMIGHMASKAGEEGISRFLQMLATISINLAIFNLLPIPVLDGGHLLLFALEAIKRGPLSIRTRQIASFVGLAIVVFLMLFAFKNDFERYWSLVFG
ncbi:MAG: RIP metalloprotease RseP [Myxococcota bacterium]|jgi:regulator of sigma E protease|nr:RIP metalloprotease RseP [Myxococcota bacterium]